MSFDDYFWLRVLGGNDRFFGRNWDHEHHGHYGHHNGGIYNNLYNYNRG